MPETTPADTTCKDLRRHRRIYTSVKGRLVAAFTDIECTVVDISPRGAKLRVACHPFPVGEKIALSIPKIGFAQGLVVGKEGDEISVEFDPGWAKERRFAKRINEVFLSKSGPIED